jgi:hypothetical protein
MSPGQVDNEFQQIFLGEAFSGMVNQKTEPKMGGERNLFVIVSTIELWHLHWLNI